MQSEGGIVIGKPHTKGGEKFELAGQTVELEGNEIVLCRDSYYSTEVFEFTDTPYNILMAIQSHFSCNVGKVTHVEPNEYVICKKVINDHNKVHVKGTVKDIVNKLQADKGCVVNLNGCETGTCSHEKETFETGGPTAKNHIETVKISEIENNNVLLPTIKTPPHIGMENKPVYLKNVPTSQGIAYGLTDEGRYVKFTDGSDGYFADEDLVEITELPVPTGILAPLDPSTVSKYEALKADILRDIENPEIHKATIHGMINVLKVDAIMYPQLYGDFCNFVLALPAKYIPVINPYVRDYKEESVIEYLKNGNINLLELLPVKEYKLPKYKPFETSPDDKTFMSIHAAFTGGDELRPVMMGTRFDEFGAVSTDAHRMLFTPYRGAAVEKPGQYCHTKRCFEKHEEVEGGKYPNYAPIIPKNDVKVACNTGGLYNFLQNIVKLSLLKGQYIEAIGITYGEQTKSVNAIFLLEGINALIKLGHKDVEFGFSEVSEHTILIYPAHEGDKIYNYSSDRPKTDCVLIMALRDNIPAISIDIETGCCKFIDHTDGELSINPKEFCFDLQHMENERKETEKKQLEKKIEEAQTEVKTLKQQQEEREQRDIERRAEIKRKKEERIQAKADKKAAESLIDNLLKEL